MSQYEVALYRFNSFKQRSLKISGSIEENLLTMMEPRKRFKSFEGNKQNGSSSVNVRRMISASASEARKYWRGDRSCAESIPSS